MTAQDTLTGRPSTLGELYTGTRAKINALTEQGCAWPSADAPDAIWAGSPQAADQLAAIAISLAADVPPNDRRKASHGRLWSQPVAHKMLWHLIDRVNACGLYAPNPLITQAREALFSPKT